MSVWPEMRIRKNASGKAEEQREDVTSRRPDLGAIQSVLQDYAEEDRPALRELVLLCYQTERSGAHEPIDREWLAEMESEHGPDWQDLFEQRWLSARVRE